MRNTKMEKINNPNNDELINKWNIMIDESNRPKKLTIFLRVPIILMSLMLIGMIWLLIIPYSLLFGFWMCYPLHSFEFIMQPYYWLECSLKNDFKMIL